MIKKKQFIPILVICIIILAIVFGIYFIMKNNYKAFTNAFNSSEKQVIVLARDNCHWCELFHPIILEVKEKYNITYTYIETNGLLEADQADMLEKLNIKSLGTPYTVIVQNGEVIAEKEGYVTEEDFVEFLTDNGIIK